MKEIKTGSDFSGVGAFDYAIERVCKAKGYEHNRIFACDWDKFARITYSHNHGEPDYFPKDVYDREIPKDSLDVYMSSPPCQDFSKNGNRPDYSDKTVLVNNTHEFILKNRPRFFGLENVLNLLDHRGGTTFQNWLSMFGGKSVNGTITNQELKYEGSVPYHLYWKVLKSSNHGIPQNRERVFLIGIRDDNDNTYPFPKDEELKTFVSDILENHVSEKYDLSEKTMKDLIIDRHDSLLKIRSGTKKGYEIASVGDVVNYAIPKSKTRRGRIGKNIAHTLDTQCNQGVYTGEKLRKFTPRECFRLQDFPDSFDFSVVSDSQAYKQAGNSITVRVLEKILMNLNL